MLTEQAYHLIVSVGTAGQGAVRRMAYALSDVIKRTDAGNDPLGEWVERNPGRHAVWLQWSPLTGIQPGGETQGASRLALAHLKHDRLAAALERELLRGVEVALRIENGYYGEGESHVNFTPKEVPDGGQG